MISSELLGMSLAPVNAFTELLAYIGPGITGGAIAAVIGVIIAIFLGIFSVLYYPIKRMLKKRKQPAGTTAASEEPE